jgi:DNA invertase Pin-like site-specific DNA recombinase
VKRKLVAYYRGTDEAEIQAQARRVESRARDEGAEILRRFRDPDSGRPHRRTGLAEALDLARRERADLIVPTLKGVSRNVSFLRAVRESGVGLLVCDLPGVEGPLVHVLLTLAEYEASHVSARVKAGQAAYKARGGKLGSARPGGRRLTAEERARGARRAASSTKARADDAYRALAPLISEWRAAGRSLREIADRLNAEGHTTRQGRHWSAMQVSRVLRRTT